MNYKKTYKHREQSTIEIRRFNSGWITYTPVPGMPDGGVPITPSSRRRFKLMEEDSITLSFSLGNVVEFRVGDFIDDKLFGRFVLRERQLPTYNKSTGGWDYQLRFDNEYWLWENHLLMLTAPLANAEGMDEEDGVITPSQSDVGRYKRIESVWCLTAPLNEHVKQILCNLLAAGLAYKNGTNMKPYRARILPTAKKSDEVRFMQYNAMPICTALKRLAEEYECEWWVTYEKETTAGQTDTVGYINFGKCENDNEPLIFRPGDNMEGASASRDLSSYANRLFVFGSDKNVPESYRKKFFLHIDSMETIDVEGVSKVVFWDSGKEGGYPKFDPYEMLLDPGTEKDPLTFGMYASNAVITYSGSQTTSNRVTVSVRATSNVAWHDDYMAGETSEELSWGRVVLGLTELARGSELINLLTCSGSLYLEEYENGQLTNSRQIASDYKIIPWNDQLARGAQVEFNAGKVTLEGGKHYRVRAELDVQGNSSFAFGGVVQAEGTFSYPRGKTFKAKITWNDGVRDEVYDVTFNPAAVLPNAGRVCSFLFDNGVPQGFVVNDAVNEEVELHEYKSITIPLSWYTDEDDDPSSVVGFGERRLKLPLTDPQDPNISYRDGYLQIANLPELERQERVVFAESIYPKCYLRVKAVIPQEDRTEKMELSDGTTYTWQWTAYGLYLEKLDGSDFPFEASYVKTGEKLQAVFLSEMDADAAYNSDPNAQRPQTDGEYLLAGMTFDVSFENIVGQDRKYTILRNEDYGAKLPNDILKPTVGDVLVLIGWDVKAMDDLGLIEDAESNLLAFGKDYLQALQVEGWTFRCEMMSDWPWLLHGGNGLNTAVLRDGQSNIITVEDGEEGHLPLRVKLGRYGWGNDNSETPNKYDLPLEGARVTVEHAALSDGSKTSRVIGYELKLDIPYDSPVYEVGETEAYSRIKQLERKLQKL